MAYPCQVHGSPSLDADPHDSRLTGALRESLFHFCSIKCPLLMLSIYENATEQFYYGGQISTFRAAWL